MDEIMKVDGVPENKIVGLSSDANQLLQVAKRQMEISSNEQLQAVGNELVRIKDVRKQVVDLFKEPKEKAYQAHKSVCDAESKLLKPLKEAEDVLSRMVSNYNFELQRKAREEAARLQREAEAAAELERQKLLAKAEKAMDKGNDGKAEALMQEADSVIPMVPIAPVYEVPKVEGLNFKQNWTWECVDINQVPREYLMLDEKKLNAQAKATKDSIKVPGIRFYDAGSVARAS